MHPNRMYVRYMSTTSTAAPAEPLGLIAERAGDLAGRGVTAAHDHDSAVDGLTPVAVLLRAIDRLLAAVVTVLLTSDHSAVIAAEGLTRASWLRAVADRTGADAGMLLAAADRLADMPATLTAFQSGTISWGTVRGILGATRSLTVAQRGWVDRALAGDDDRLGRVDGDRIIAEAEALADRARPDLHADRADRAAADQHLVLQPGINGGGQLFATLDPETFAAVSAAIDGIARDGAGRRVASNVDALRALARQRVTLPGDQRVDDRGATTDTHVADRLGDDTGDATAGGAGEIGDGDGDGDGNGACCGMATGVRPAPSTARPELIAVTDVRLLVDPDLCPDPYAGLDRRGAATLDIHSALEPAQGVARLLWRHDRPAPRLTRHAARRLACDATIRPVLVDGRGRVLGTAEPYAKVSTALRAALTARDGGCRFPACHASVEVCDAHHIVHRVDGGPTVLANLVLLCTRHHRAVHEGGWTPQLDIATGAMTFARRGTTLHTDARLPTATSDRAEPPPRGRPRRRSARTRRSHEPPPSDRPPPAGPPGSSDVPQPREPLPF
jgi:hypothetical protein